MEIPFNLHPASPKFIEDYKRYKAKQQEIWNNNTILIKHLVSDGKGGTRVLNIRRPKSSDEVEQLPVIAPLGVYQQFSTGELKVIQLKNETQAIIEARNSQLLKVEAKLNTLQGNYRSNRSQCYRYINLKRSVARLRQAAEQNNELTPNAK